MKTQPKSLKSLSLWTNLVDAVGLAPGPNRGHLSLAFHIACRISSFLFSSFPLSYELKHLHWREDVMSIAVLRCYVSHYLKSTLMGCGCAKGLEA